MVVGTTKTSYGLATNIHFDRFLKWIDSRLELVGRKGVTADVLQLSIKGQAYVKDRIHSSPIKVAFSADIWTKPGFAVSYLGVSGHYADIQKGYVYQL